MFEKASKARQLEREAGNLEKSVKSIIPKKLDFSEFEKNNWIKPSAAKNRTLKAIHSKGGAVWISPSGELYFRRRPGEDAEKVVNQKAITVLANFLDKPAILLFRGTGSGENYIEPDIAANDVLMIGERFTPFTLSEFYEDDGAIYRTAFEPSRFLKMQAGVYREPVTITKLLRHLSNYNDEYFKWFINWLAGFFQTLRKSQVSLVLRGSQGAGKGILMDHIISPLLGKEYVVIVDDGRLETNFKGSWITNSLFYNLNEVSHDDRKDRNQKKNFIKMLVTDSSVQTEEKNERSRTSVIFGNVLITSNEALPIAVETSDRRFTIFQTSGSLKKDGWNTGSTIKSIKEELADFAVMLKSYQVDWELYDTAMDTPEKQAIVSLTNDRYVLFLNAIKKRDEKFFEMQIDNLLTMNEIRDIFDKGFISSKQITEIFNECFDEDKRSRTIMKMMRAYDAIMFSKPSKRIMGDRFYKILEN